LQDVQTVPFGGQFYGYDKVITSLSKSSPVVLIKNDCVVVTGDKLLQTFDYLEVAEFSAKSLVLAASIGSLVPINDEQVNELRAAFIKE
jgi:L-fuculose-phosphate aldolase